MKTRLLEMTSIFSDTTDECLVVSFPDEINVIRRETILKLMDITEKTNRPCVVKVKSPSWDFSRCFLYSGFQKKGNDFVYRP
jgi:hypothetical protein